MTFEQRRQEEREKSDMGALLKYLMRNGECEITMEDEAARKAHLHF